MTDKDNLVPKPKLQGDDYGERVLQGLEYIHHNPYKNKLDRHIAMMIPNSLAKTKGTSANTFLTRAGEIQRDKDTGVKVTLEVGHSFTHVNTGLTETMLVIDFEYTNHINFDLLRKYLA